VRAKADQICSEALRLLTQFAGRIVCRQYGDLGFYATLLCLGRDEGRETPLAGLDVSAVLSGLPITLVFLFAQRWIVSGLTAGGVKG
jgi:hypothetical protein